MVAMDGTLSLSGRTKGGFFKSLTRKFLNDETCFQQNGHLVAWEKSLDYELSINTSRSGLLGKLVSSQTTGEGIVLKFKGPGAVYVCSRNKGGFLNWVFSQMPEEKAVKNE